jgi:hypothetical protein
MVENVIPYNNSDGQLWKKLVEPILSTAPG